MIAGGAAADLPVADVCIVGAGPVGLALASSLEERGLSVLIVEAGALDGQSNVSDNFGPIDYTNAHHATAGMTSHGLGGTSALWGGRCVEFDDLDFAERAHVPHSGWPISHADVRDHYAAAFAFLNCGAAPADGKDVHGGDAVTSTVERWSARPALGPLHKAHLRASKRITLLSEATVFAIELEPEGLVVESLMVQRQGRALPVRAKNYVLAGGGLENARLLLATQRHWPAKFGGPQGALGRFYQGHITGHISVIEFADKRVEKALSFQKDKEGRHFRRRLQVSAGRQHDNHLLNAAFWLDALSIADAAHGSGALSALYLPLAISGLYGMLSEGRAPKTARGRQQGYREHLLNLRSDPALFRDLAASASSLIGSRLPGRRTLPSPKGRYLLRYHAEQRPIPESRVVLDDSPSHAYLPALKVNYLVDDEDVASVVRSHQLLDHWLGESGTGKLAYLHEGPECRQAVRRQAFDGYHQIGLTRMSKDPRDGVVNADCRLHDVANLYVAGSAVFPTGGQANPTLPAVALALRLGAHLAQTRRA
ncbi:GMC oxidoreductase [Sinorhizobium fredii]|uniref:GMC oxidoreductase n=1 Tax=Rhizobium fredii TaxID=380 RepID=UPI0005956275|nr:GMC oxidoreductase [Sinorhizobium fredii]WOS65712.1 GMC oxidoreductase [Sinorhizobium fredii GR64]